MAEETTQPQAAGAASSSSARQVVARHPVATFLVVCYAVNWAVVLPPLRIQGGLPFGLQLWESLGTLLGVALPAFLVVAASDGRTGVRDLTHRCLRWRVGARWYLVALLGVPIAVVLCATALFGSVPLTALVDKGGLLLTLVLPQLLLLVVLFNVAEEIGWTGFMQARLQERHGPLKASLMVTIPFALFHVPALFVESGLVLALVILPFLAILHLFARVVIMWLYNNARSSVLLVGLFHSSFNTTVDSVRQFIPGPAMTTFWIATGVVSVAAVVIVVATKGRLSYEPKPGVRPTAAPE